MRTFKFSPLRMSVNVCTQKVSIFLIPFYPKDQYYAALIFIVSQGGGGFLTKEGISLYPRFMSLFHLYHKFMSEFLSH